MFADDIQRTTHDDGRRWMAIVQLSVVPSWMQTVCFCECDFLVDLEQKGVTSKLKNIKHYLVIILTENLWYWNILLSIDWYVFLLNRKYKILHILHRKQSRRYMYEIIYCTLEKKNLNFEITHQRQKLSTFYDKVCYNYNITT